MLEHLFYKHFIYLPSTLKHPKIQKIGNIFIFLSIFYSAISRIVDIRLKRRLWTTQQSIKTAKHSPGIILGFLLDRAGTEMIFFYYSAPSLLEMHITFPMQQQWGQDTLWRKNPNYIFWIRRYFWWIAFFLQFKIFCGGEIRQAESFSFSVLETKGFSLVDVSRKIFPSLGL